MDDHIFLIEGLRARFELEDDTGGVRKGASCDFVFGPALAQGRRSSPRLSPRGTMPP